MSKLPSVVSSLPQDLKAFINQVREALDGRNGEKLVTVNDLIRGGIAAPGPGNTVVPPAGVVGTPATPKNVQASGAINNIIVTWDDPLYNGHAYAEVWGSSTDDLGAAVQIGMTPGAIFVDAVGPSVVRYYWVRFVNVTGVQGAFNAIAGARGESGSDVTNILELLTGQITETQLFSSLNSRIDNIEVNTTAIQTEATTRANADSALSSQISTVSAAVSSNTAAIQTEATTRANADSALSSQISTVSATTNNNTVAIQTEATTRASETGSLFAKYTVKVDVNGYVSGFGLASTANNATPFSDFAIRADRFYVASPSGPGLTPIIPFIVNTTTQTVNGVSVPPGIYMDAAFVKNGTIVNAKIGNAAIDDAKIANLSAGKITAGFISADRIQANSLTAGTISTAKAIINVSSFNSYANRTTDANGQVSIVQNIPSGFGTPIFSVAVSTASVAQAVSVVCAFVSTTSITIVVTLRNTAGDVLTSTNIPNIQIATF
jgi:predicted phage tail protein